MSGVNKVILIGHLGKDPEQRAMPSGKAVANFSLATSERYKDKQTGEQQEKTEWHRVTCFDRLGEIAGQYLHKGSKVYIEGKLRTRKYEKDGQTHYATEVIADSLQMLDGKPSAQAPQAAPGKPARHATPAGPEEFNDDIPF